MVERLVAVASGLGVKSLTGWGVLVVGCGLVKQAVVHEDELMDELCHLLCKARYMVCQIVKFINNGVCDITT